MSDYHLAMVPSAQESLLALRHTEFAAVLLCVSAHLRGERLEQVADGSDLAARHRIGAVIAVLRSVLAVFSEPCLQRAVEAIPLRGENARLLQILAAQESGTAIH